MASLPRLAECTSLEVARLARDRRTVVLLPLGASPRTSRVTRMLRSARPDLEWHSGELETSMMLDAAPHLVRRAAARRLRPAFVDWRSALKRGATFRTMHPTGAGYFGSPAAARASAGRRAMTLRARLIAAETIGALRRTRGPARAQRTISRDASGC